MIKISVVIPSYNRKEYISDAVLSVLNQTKSVFEVIIVDDGSTDDTFLFIQSKFSSPLVQCVRQNNNGAGAARNVGMSLAKGDWIAFLDSDDQWLPQKIEHFLQEMQSAPEVDFFYTATTRGLEDGHHRDSEHAADSSDAQGILSTFSVKTSTVIVRSDLVREHDLTFGAGRTCEDYEFFWKAASVARCVVYSHMADTVIGRSADSLMVTQNGWKLFRDNVKAIDNVLSWMVERGIDVSLRESLLGLRHWQVRNAIAAAALDGQYKELLNCVYRAYEYYDFFKALRLASSAVRVVLTRHNRAWLRSYGLPKRDNL